MEPAYIAGLIDGEGYLGILPARVKGLKNKSFEPVVKVGMTDNCWAVFETMRAIYGGSIDTRKVKTTGGRTAYTYNLKSRVKVKKLLDDITPFLHIKKGQAILLSEFCDLPSTHSLYGSFDQKVLDRKIELYTLLKQLKQPLATTK